MIQPNCNVFVGVSGAGVVLLCTILAFSTYVCVFVARRRSKKETRTWLVFSLDLSKIVIAQGIAWLINLANTQRNANSTSGTDPLSWYFPTFLNDELLAVPLGVGLGRLVCYTARYLDRNNTKSNHKLAPLHHFGRYSPSRHPNATTPSLLLDEPLQGPYAHSQPKPKISWWAIQLTAWVCCVAISRFVGGLGVPLLQALFGESSPWNQLARAIHKMSWSCPTKRWFFAGFLRIAVDVAQVAFVDFFNKFVAKPTQRPAPSL